MTSECIVRIVELARALRSAPYRGLSGLYAVLRTWRTAWPQGKWLMTTDAWLQGDYLA
jgi:hypothetical protein